MTKRATIKIRQEPARIGEMPDPFGGEFVYFAEAKGDVYEIGDSAKEAADKAITKLIEAGHL